MKVKSGGNSGENLHSAFLANMVTRVMTTDEAWAK